MGVALMSDAILDCLMWYTARCELMRRASIGFCLSDLGNNGDLSEDDPAAVGAVSIGTSR